MFGGTCSALTGVHLSQMAHPILFIIGSGSVMSHIVLQTSFWQAGLQAIGTLTIIFVFWALKTRYLVSYRNLPSPPGHWTAGGLSASLKNTRNGEVLGQWFAQSGRTLLIRTNPFYRPIIITSDPSFIGYIHRQISDFEGSPRLGSVLASMGLEHGISNAMGQSRKRSRRALELAFSRATMKALFPDMLVQAARARDDVVATTMSDSVAGSKHRQPQPVDLLAVSTKYMIDVVGKCIFGVDYGAHPKGVAAEIQSTVKSFYKERQGLSWWDSNGIIRTSKNKRVSESRNAIGSLGQRLLLEKKLSVRDGFGPSPKRSDMLQSETDILTRLCQSNMAQDLPTNQRMTDSELAHNVPIFVLASTDATVRQLALLFYQLATHPDVQDRLRAEIRTVSSENPTLDALSHLPYLNAVIEESLRLDNAYTYVARSATRKCEVPLRHPVQGRDGKLMQSVTVEKGTEVWIAMKNMNTDTELYGLDAEMFRPERFLDGSHSPTSEKVKELRATWGSTIGFSGGERGCPVYNFPLAVTTALVWTIVRFFRLSVPKEQSVEVLLNIVGGQEIHINGKISRSMPLSVKLLSEEG